MDIGKKKRMLITGVSGMLGNNLAYYFKNTYDVLGLYNRHPVKINGVVTERCDLNKTEDIDDIVKTIMPDVLIHCASLTEIDACESDKKMAEEVNVTGTKNIVGSLSDTNTKLIFISSDAVYDGNGDRKFDEDDPVYAQQNFYGHTKYYGERNVLNRHGSIVFRTNMFGWNIQDKQSLGEWVLKELLSGKIISGFKDVYFSTIYSLELARVIDIALQKDISGVYNCGSSDYCSKYEFILKIAKHFDLSSDVVVPISVDDVNFSAKRGKNLRLNIQKLEGDLNYRLPKIDDSISAFYRDYKCRLPDMIKEGSKFDQKQKKIIQYGKQWIWKEDTDAVNEVLQSERITQGPKVDEFEQALARYCGAKYAVAVNSGTSALHIACLTADVGKDDEVITSPNTFVASANCVVYCDGTPVFADIDSKTYNISPAEIDHKINRKTKAIIPVHFAGQSCDMEAIKESIDRFGKKKIYIIEDASHALGSIYKKTKVGSCKFSDMTVMSFHPVKHITTGEGGAVLTNEYDLYQKLLEYRSHGITSRKENFLAKKENYTAKMKNGKEIDCPWYYEQQSLGYNYRITDIQSALGISQLRKIDFFQTKRRKIVNFYNHNFSKIDFITTPGENVSCFSNFHLYVLLIDFDGIGCNRSEFMNILKDKGVQTQVHYIPVYRHPFYKKRFRYKKKMYPHAEEYYRNCLSIPLYPAMHSSDAQKVVDEIKRLCKER